ncbi:hypothetical protein HGRIS_003155 [Hohenbuehelia grisea]|uniref:Uncharacterized protein n=1 Tax=Hohenbuehelia grisea TaxID=104357 RepID=A0ABR3JMV3_9AGAR
MNDSLDSLYLSSQFANSLSFGARQMSSQNCRGEDTSAQPQASQETPELVPTQPATQPSASQDPMDGLWGILHPLSGVLPRIEFQQVHESHTIGKAETNSIRVVSDRIGKNHCAIQWNGRFGDQANATIKVLTDRGTYIDNEKINKYEHRILRHGRSVLSFGHCQPPANKARSSDDHRYMFMFSPHVRQATQLFQKYDLLHELGNGTFGTVWKALHITGNRFYAIKLANRTGRNNDESRAQQELAAMRRVPPHQNVCSLVEYLMDDNDTLSIVMEWCNRGDLENFCFRDGGGRGLRESQVKDFTRQLLSGLSHIHSAGIVHRDLKPANILIHGVSNESLTLKIADFGLSKVAQASGLQTKCGTPAFMAPEIRMMSYQSKYTASVDIFSLGMVVVFMFCPGRNLFEPEDLSCSTMNTEVYQCIPWEARWFIRDTVAAEPARRMPLEGLGLGSWFDEDTPPSSRPEWMNKPLPPGSFPSMGSSIPGFGATPGKVSLADSTARHASVARPDSDAYGTPQTGTAVNSAFLDGVDMATTANTSVVSGPSGKTQPLKRGRSQLSASFSSTGSLDGGLEPLPVPTRRGGPSNRDMAPPLPRASRTKRPAPKKLRKEEEGTTADSEEENPEMSPTGPATGRGLERSRSRGGARASDVETGVETASAAATQPQPSIRRTPQKNHHN